VEHVAADDPETAAKIALPNTFTCSNRPGTRLNHGDNPANMFSAKRVRNKISPIQRKRGKAVSVQLDVDPQMVKTMLSPTGRGLTKIMVTKPMARSEKPIQKPVAKSKMSKTTSPTASVISMVKPP